MPKADPLQNQRLGRRGEARFASWCQDTGILPQKSDPDQLGWDYFIEIEPIFDKKAPLDREVDLKKALVQVKATNRRSKTVRASLSSLKRLVDSDLPAFIAHIDFSGQVSPQCARLLHIWKEQIEAILRAIRVAEKKGDRDLHDVELSLSLEQAAEITVDGANLKSLVLSCVPGSQSSYIEEKSAFRRCCGWDENSIITNLKVSPGQGTEALVDLLIGKAPEIKLDEAIIDKRRFGISLDKDIDQISSGILKVDIKPCQKAKAIVSSCAVGGVEMDVDVFAPNIPDLPLEFRKLRVANDYLDMVMHFGTEKGQMTFYIDPEKEFSLHALANALSFGVALSHDQAKLEIDFGDFGSQSLNVPAEAASFSRWELLSEFASVLSNGLFRSRKSAVCEMTIVQLQECLEENKNMFAMLARPGFELTYVLDEKCPVPPPKSGAIISPICIEFGSFAYTAVVKAEFSSLKVEDRTISFLGSDPRVIEDTIIDRKAISFERINQRVSAISKLEAHGDRCVITSGLRDEISTDIGGSRTA